MNAPKSTIVVGDFNCRTVAAGAGSSNNRGLALEELLGTTGLVCINDGSPTFYARGHSSILDLVLIDGRFPPDMVRMQDLQVETASDHLAVSVEIHDTETHARNQHLCFRLSERQIETIVRKVATKITDGRPVTPDTLQQIMITELARLPERATRHHPVYWWSSDIADQRRVLQSMKRRVQRLRTRAYGADRDLNTAITQYRAARKQLNFMIKHVKRQKWRELCSELDADP
ncbi:uncharacterized protein LOC142328386 [Lycorma delicatula]|uniref:uncharacterized protein LOC142328386 n=1 Tax=Lycorma delicatula TaxID=130591 RepID=UPI003F5171B1